MRVSSLRQLHGEVDGITQIELNSIGIQAFVSVARSLRLLHPRTSVKLRHSSFQRHASMKVPTYLGLPDINCRSSAALL